MTFNIFQPEQRSIEQKTRVSHGFVGFFLIGWGVFNVVDALARHDISQDWLLFGTGVGFVLLGVILRRMEEHSFIERRSGLDRRSASPLR